MGRKSSSARARLGRCGLVGAIAVCAALAGEEVAPAAPKHRDATLDLGPNVRVFDPSMPTSEIRAAVDAIAQSQLSNQFGPQRYALLFKPGTYGSATDPLTFQVGDSTEVAASAPRRAT
jgi:hypothetical protein